MAKTYKVDVPDGRNYYRTIEMSEEEFMALLKRTEGHPQPKKVDTDDSDDPLNHTVGMEWWS